MAIGKQYLLKNQSSKFLAAKTLMNPTFSWNLFRFSHKIAPKVSGTVCIILRFQRQLILQSDLYKCTHISYQPLLISHSPGYSLNCLNCLLTITNFTSKLYSLPAVGRLASRGEQWLHVFYIYIQIADKQD